MAKLGDICRFQSGGTPSKNISSYYGGNIPWITTIALNGSTITENDAIAWITPTAISDTAAKIVPAQSILVGTRVGIGKVAINTIPISTNQDILALIDIDEKIWNKKYLIYAISAKKAYLNSVARGATIKGIKKEILENLEIKKISLLKQQKISDTLDKINNLYFIREQQLSKLDQLVKSRFIEMFGECKTNLKNWKLLNMEEIADVGSSKRVFVEELQKEGIPFYRGTEVGVLAEGKSIAPELYITEKHYKELVKATGIPQPGDLLMPSICPDGRIWVVNTKNPFYFKDGRVLWIHNIDTKFNSTFLLYTLKDRIMTDYLSIASGTTFAELKIFTLKKCKIFSVPLPLQEQFADFIQQVDKVKSSVKQSLEKLETLKESLMQEYFG